jgi:hypothetical protein
MTFHAKQAQSELRIPAHSSGLWQQRALNGSRREHMRVERQRGGARRKGATARSLQQQLGSEG